MIHNQFQSARYEFTRQPNNSFYNLFHSHIVIIVIHNWLSANKDIIILKIMLLYNTIHRGPMEDFAFICPDSCQLITVHCATMASFGNTVQQNNVIIIKIYEPINDFTFRLCTCRRTETFRSNYHDFPEGIGKVLFSFAFVWK